MELKDSAFGEVSKAALPNIKGFARATSHYKPPSGAKIKPSNKRKKYVSKPEQVYDPAKKLRGEAYWDNPF